LSTSSLRSWLNKILIVSSCLFSKYSNCYFGFREETSMRIVFQIVSKYEKKMYLNVLHETRKQQVTKIIVLISKVFIIYNKVLFQLDNLWWSKVQIDKVSKYLQHSIEDEITHGFWQLGNYVDIVFLTKIKPMEHKLYLRLVPFVVDLLQHLLLKSLRKHCKLEKE